MIKKKGWIPYKRKAKSIEINVKDNQEQTIDFFKLYKDKTRDTRRIIEKIKEKYEIDLNPEDIDEKEFKEKIMKKDLSW